MSKSAAACHKLVADQRVYLFLGLPRERERATATAAAAAVNVVARATDCCTVTTELVCELEEDEIKKGSGIMRL